MKILKGYMFRLYPDKNQELLINKTIGSSRFIYNYFLADRINYYKNTKKGKTAYDQIKMIPTLLKEYPFLKEIDSCALRNSAFILDNAYQNFFNKSGFPKFKRKGINGSYKTTNNKSTYKGKKYIGTPQKYYFADIGLRNARLNFRQQEENHLMENIIYNELLIRGYNVDVGVVEIREGDSKKKLEVDFVCNLGSKRYYIQSALTIEEPEKASQETRPLNNIGDSFKKIIVVRDDIKLWRNDEGILIIGIKEFLLNKNSLDL